MPVLLAAAIQTDELTLFYVMPSGGLYSVIYIFIEWSTESGEPEQNCSEQEIIKEKKTRLNKWRFLNRSQAI